LHHARVVESHQSDVSRAEGRRGGRLDTRNWHEHARPTAEVHGAGKDPLGKDSRDPVTDHRPPPELATSLERDGETIVLRVTGEVDLVNAHELAEAMRQAADQGGALVVDLREVPFMDSTGLRSVIQTRERLQQEGRPPLRVRVQPESTVSRLLDLVGLRDLLAGD
jgi:anti-anti-sigma factor